MYQTKQHYGPLGILRLFDRLLRPLEAAWHDETAPRRTRPAPTPEPVPDYTAMEWHTYAEPLTVACFGPAPALAPVDPPEHESWGNDADVDEDGDTVVDPTPILPPTPTLYRKVGKGYKLVSIAVAEYLPSGTRLYTRSSGTGRAARYTPLDATPLTTWAAPERGR